jgi:hypothetical protein
MPSAHGPGAANEWYLQIACTNNYKSRAEPSHCEQADCYVLQLRCEVNPNTMRSNGSVDRMAVAGGGGGGGAQGKKV